MSEDESFMTVDHFIVMLANKIMVLNTELDYDDLIILKEFLDRRLTSLQEKLHEGKLERSVLKDLILNMILCGKPFYMSQY